MHWSDKWTVTNQHPFFIGWCDYFAIQSPWRTTRMLLKGLRPHPHKTGHFQTGYLFLRIRVDRAFNYSGKRFQKYAVSVRGLTGCALTDEPIRVLICGFKKHPDSSGWALNETRNCSYHKWLIKGGDAKWKQNSSEQKIAKKFRNSVKGLRENGTESLYNVRSGLSFATCLECGLSTC